MQYGTDTLWGDNDPLIPPKRRSWKAEVAGLGLVVLGIACGIVGFKWGGSRNIKLVTIGVGIALIGAGSFLASWGGGRRVTRAVLLAVGMVIMLGGIALVVFAVTEPAGIEDPAFIFIGAGILALGLGLGLVSTSAGLRGAASLNSQVCYLQLEHQDVQREIKEGEKRAEIDRELRASDS